MDISVSREGRRRGQEQTSSIGGVERRSVDAVEGRGGGDRGRERRGVAGWRRWAKGRRHGNDDCVEIVRGLSCRATSLWWVYVTPVSYCYHYIQDNINLGNCRDVSGYFVFDCMLSWNGNELVCPVCTVSIIRCTFWDLSQKYRANYIYYPCSVVLS